MLNLVKLLWMGMFVLSLGSVLSGCGGGDANQTKSPAKTQQDQQDGSAGKPANAEQGSDTK